MDDDDTGWNEILVGGWTDEVRDRVVDRVEELTRGWRAPLVRTLRDPHGVPPPWTESLHRAVLIAIQDVTGADLDLLGSHAAWGCYEEAWDTLAARWEEGGDLPKVPLRAEPRAVALLADAPAHVAEAAGADARATPPVPLWIAGRLHLDAEGLRGLLTGPAPLAGADELRVEALLACLRG